MPRGVSPCVLLPQGPAQPWMLRTGEMSSVPGGCDFHLSLGAATASHQLHSRARNWRQIPAALDMDRQDISLNPCLCNARSRDGFEGHLWLFFEASTSQFAGFAAPSPFPPFIQSLISTTTNLQNITVIYCAIQETAVSWQQY